MIRHPDDGFNTTNGLRAFKGSVYEGGIRVPMIVRYPAAVKKGTSNDTPGYFAGSHSRLRPRSRDMFAMMQLALK